MNTQLEHTEQKLICNNKKIRNKKFRKRKNNSIIRKYKYFIISALIIVLVSLISILILNLNSSHIVVAMRFSEITQGNNPDNSPFDIYEL